MKDDKRRWTESNRNKLPELLRWPKMFKCSLYIFSNVELKTPLGASVLFRGSWIFILHYMYHDNCASYCSVVVLETIFLKYLQVNLFNPFGDLCISLGVTNWTILISYISICTNVFENIDISGTVVLAKNFKDILILLFHLFFVLTIYKPFQIRVLCAKFC